MTDYNKMTAAELEKLPPAEMEKARKQLLKEMGRKVVTYKALDAVLRSMTDVVAEGVNRLSERIAALEAKEVQNIGVWEGSKEYQRGAFVQYDGGVWRCCSRESTRDQPGTSRAWLLAVKGWREGDDQN